MYIFSKIGQFYCIWKLLAYFRNNENLKLFFSVKEASITFYVSAIKVHVLKFTIMYIRCHFAILTFILEMYNFLKAWFLLSTL